MPRGVPRGVPRCVPRCVRVPQGVQNWAWVPKYVWVRVPQGEMHWVCVRKDVCLIRRLLGADAPPAGVAVASDFAVFAAVAVDVAVDVAVAVAVAVADADAVAVAFGPAAFVAVDVAVATGAKDAAANTGVQIVLALAHTLALDPDHALALAHALDPDRVPVLVPDHDPDHVPARALDRLHTQSVRATRRAAAVRPCAAECAQAVNCCCCAWPAPSGASLCGTPAEA